MSRSKYTSSDLTLIPLRPDKRLLLDELPPQGYMLGDWVSCIPLVRSIVDHTGDAVQLISLYKETAKTRTIKVAVVTGFGISAI